MQSHHHHAGGADHAEVGGRRRGVFGGHEGKDEGRWALFCDLIGVGDDDDDDDGDDDDDDDDDGDNDGVAIMMMMRMIAMMMRVGGPSSVTCPFSITRMLSAPFKYLGKPS